MNDQPQHHERADPREAAIRYRAEQAAREVARARGEDPVAGAAVTGESTPANPPREMNALQRAAYVESAIQQAIRAGEFDNLPGAGKPLAGLGGHHDPDWWIRRKIEAENLTGLGPPALALRVEHAEFEDRLDLLTRESDVREAVQDFNHRVREARRQLLGGPPVVTPTRDVHAEVAAWHERREARARDAAGHEHPQPARRRWRWLRPRRLR